MMDWEAYRERRETERHRTALLGFLAILFVYSGLADDTGSAAADTDRVRRAVEASREEWTLPRRICRRLLSLLRPVEAATRRLIVILASGLPIPKPPAVGAESSGAAPVQGGGDAPIQMQGGAGQAGGAGPASSAGDGKAPEADARPPLFALADPAKRYEWFFSGKPHGAGWTGPSPALPGDDELDVTSILRRIAALAGALDDLPAQALRLARWRSRRIRARAAGRRLALSPLRTGAPPGSLPPGAPKRTLREEHHLLSETHTLAHAALTRLDTS